MTARQRIVAGSAALACVAVLLATHARSYFFIFDDTAMISLAAQLPARELLTNQVVGFYRPLGLLLWKAEYVVFGWERPWAFAATSILLHAASALMLFLALERVGRRAGGEAAGRVAHPASSAAGAALFLASPWATEAVFWVSCQFDLLGVFFFLSSVLALLAAIERRSAAMYALSVVLYGGALFTKEFALPLLAVYPALLATRLKRPPALAGAIPFTLLAAFFLFVRSRALSAHGGALGGAYGSVVDLYAAADLPRNLWQYVRSLVLLHRKSYSLAVPAAWLYAATVLAFTAVALWRSTRTAVVAIALFAATTLPVLWTQSTYKATTSGRLLYAPALFFCVLVALGIDRARALGWPRTRNAVLAVALLAASLSTLSQVRLWTFATGVARRTVAYLLPRLDGARVVHITNLPYVTAEGPFVMKAYNIPHHLWAAGKPSSAVISADTVRISYFDPTVQASLGPDQLTAPRQASGIEITLPLDLLRDDPR